MDAEEVDGLVEEEEVSRVESFDFILPSLLEFGSSGSNLAWARERLAGMRQAGAGSEAQSGRNQRFGRVVKILI